MPLLNAETWDKAPDDYFTCQCNPPDNREGYAHRIPIDCMTAEDWQRVARERQTRAKTVWVVSVIGDEDCGAPNEGAVGVFEFKAQAWADAMNRAVEISPDDIDVEENRIVLGNERASVEVTEMEVL
jgi:hypothetical protein